MTVILLQNYPHDGRESMRRYVALLEAHLAAAGHEVRKWAPLVALGRLRPSPNGLGKWLGYIDKYLIYPPILWWHARKLRGQKQCIVHICDHSDAMYSMVLGKVPHVVTCHDLTAIKAASGELDCHRPRLPGRFYQKLILAGLMRASFTIAVSDATLKDLLRIAGTRPDRTAVVRNGLNYPYHVLPEAQLRTTLAAMFARRQAQVPVTFLLAIGSNAWHKNRSGLLDLYAALIKVLPDAPPLVIAGEMLDPALAAKARDLAVLDKLIEVGKVSNEELNTLYCGARALVFPSLAEGFGWPVIEAQACGCPVVASSLPPLLEIGGASTVFIEPQNISAAAATLAGVINQSADQCREMIESGLRNAELYGADRMFGELEAIYRRLMEETSDSPVPRELNMAPSLRSQ